MEEFRNPNGTFVYIGENGGAVRDSWAEFMNNSFSLSPGFNCYGNYTPVQNQNFEPYCESYVCHKPSTLPIINPRPPCSVYRLGTRCPTKTYNFQSQQVRLNCKR